mgnify:CR=1 FL=1
MNQHNKTPQWPGKLRFSGARHKAKQRKQGCRARKDAAQAALEKHRHGQSKSQRRARERRKKERKKEGETSKRTSLSSSSSECGRSSTPAPSPSAARGCRHWRRAAPPCGRPTEHRNVGLPPAADSTVRYECMRPGCHGQQQHPRPPRPARRHRPRCKWPGG